jgi:hypothetical protein
MPTIDPSKMQADPERTAILLQVGECLAMWSQVEHALARLFSVVTRNAVANQMGAAFTAVKSFEVRLAKVNAVIELDHDAAFRDSLNALSKKLAELYRRRHQVAHFTLLFNVTENKHTLNPFFSFGKLNVTGLSSNDLNQRCASFARALERLMRLRLYVAHRQAKLGEGLLQEGDPAVGFKTKTARIMKKRNPAHFVTIRNSLTSCAVWNHGAMPVETERSGQGRCFIPRSISRCWALPSGSEKLNSIPV